MRRLMLLENDKVFLAGLIDKLRVLANDCTREANDKNLGLRILLQRCSRRMRDAASYLTSYLEESGK